MNYRSFLTGIAAGLLLFVQTGLSSVEAAIPADAPKDIKYILRAGMAELADAHGSGPCESNFMRVRVSFPAY